MIANPPFVAANLPDTHPLATVARAPAQPSPIDRVCDEAVALLSIRMPGRVRVEHFPSKPDEYDFEGSDAAVLVIYDGSKFSTEGQRGVQGMQELLRLIVVLLVRELRGPTGAYGLCHEIRGTIHGQSLGGCTGLRPIETELESQDAGVYRYRLAFEGGLPAVPVRSAQSPLFHKTPLGAP